MKRLIIFLCLFFSNIKTADVNTAHFVIEIVNQQNKEIDEIVKKTEEDQSDTKKCPSGSSTKVKVAWISFGASIITTAVLLIIHFTS